MDPDAPATSSGAGASASPRWLRRTLAVMAVVAVLGCGAALWALLGRPPCYPGTIELLPVIEVLAALMWIIAIPTVISPVVASRRPVGPFLALAMLSAGAVAGYLGIYFIGHVVAFLGDDYSLCWSF